MYTGTRRAPDSKWLIVNADDFGLSEKTNKGILDAHLQGIVTSSGLMLNMPALSDAINISRQHPSLDIGIHINLTWGRPLSTPGRISTLVGQDGQFMDKRALIISLLTGKVEAPHLENEIRAQIERFLSTGLAPYHMDVHQHLHAIPSVTRLIIRLAGEYGIPCLRNLKERLSPNLTTLAIRLFLMISNCGINSNSNILSSNYFAGIALTGKWNEKKKKKVRRLIFKLRPGITELVCHPGYTDPDLMPVSRLVAERQEELHLLTSPLLKNWLEEAKVTLTSYRDLLQGGWLKPHCH